MDDVKSASLGKPPEAPSRSVNDWVKRNLFSNVPNTILTLVFGFLALYAIRGLLGFVMSGERRWAAVATNMRLLMAQGYPAEQFVRVWVTLGCLMVLTGISLAVWRSRGTIQTKRIASWIINLGIGAAVFALLSPISPNARWSWLVVAAVLIAIGTLLRTMTRRDMVPPELPTIWFSFSCLALVVLSLWTVPYGHYAFTNGELVAETGRTVANSTKLPFTVMLLLLVGSFWLVSLIQNLIATSKAKAVLSGLWLLAPFVLNWIVLRDPDFDYGRVFSVDIPIGLIFILFGFVILYPLTNPSVGEKGRLVAIALLMFAAFNWVAAFFGMYPMLQKVRISFLLLALAALLAPNFAADKRTRLRFISFWSGFIIILHWLITAINSPSTLDLQGPTYLGGFSLTLFVAVLTLLLSFPLGVLLALGRTSSMPIARVLCTVYIESVRGVPLITILFFFSNILPLFLPAGMEIAELAAIVTGYTLFSAAYLAENVRGGLQSVMRGQYEAADAIGLTTSQRTGFIVIPQALRVSIPPLVGQAIGVFKETSLVAIVGAFDILRIAAYVVPAQTEFLGVKREGLLLISVIYFVVAFSMSKYSQKLEERVGLGER